MLRVEMGTERLVRVTLEHRVVTLVYQGLRRTVEPHLIGMHEAGEPLLVGYQTGGFSGSGEVPGWRTRLAWRVRISRHWHVPTPMTPAQRPLAAVWDG